MSTRERRDRSNNFDRELSQLFQASVDKNKVDATSVALAAVGGFGRGELSPGSDLDLTILHDGKVKNLEAFVNDFLYPLWSQGIPIDHSVRTIKELDEVIHNDLRVILGLLDIRFLTGNRNLVEEVENFSKALWQKNIRKYLPKIKETINERTQRSGELAFLLEPDLKEARGGLRDANLLRAISSSGITTVPLERVSEAEVRLQNVRDVLHTVASKPRDQLLLTEQDKVAEVMGYGDADALCLDVSKSARTIDYVMDSVWHKLDHKKTFFRKNKRVGIAAGISIFENEVVIDIENVNTNISALGIRAAAFAAQKGLPLSQESALWLAENYQPLPNPWPREVREDLIAFIGAGRSMIKVFEALDQENLISKWIPEWDHVRFLPQRNVLHRHTVDRHMLETVVEAGEFTRTVRRPDLLLFASLFHDIGKGYLDEDHSEYGAKLIINLAKRVGFPEADVKILELLVREHLALSTAATRRDLDDPQTIKDVVDKLINSENLNLLHALSIADGKATGKSAWSEWKATLVQDLVSRAKAAMSGEKPEEQPDLVIADGYNGELLLTIEPRETGFEIGVTSRDQVGLLSVIAGVLSINRLDLRNAKTKTIGDFAVGKWIVAPDINSVIPQREKLIEQIKAGLSGDLDIQSRIDERISAYRKLPGILTPAPIVSASNDIATNATVIEIRMHDRPGIIYSVAKSISRQNVDIKAVILSTLGAEAFDTLYVSDLNGMALSEERAKLLANQVETALITYR